VDWGFLLTLDMIWILYGNDPRVDRLDRNLDMIVFCFIPVVWDCDFSF
jgi:hypothetical protein